MGWSKEEIRTVLLRTALLFAVALIGLDLFLAVFRPSPDESDALLGWKLKESFHRVFVQKTWGGQTYLADFSTNASGFRVYGTNERAPVRILVLGDSFTADPYAGNARMWYGKMAERLAQHLHRPMSDVYVLAGGGGGWGTYQELLLSQRIAPTGWPNVFVLQFCANDFENNTYEWESKGVVRAQWMRRPFANLRTGRTEYARGIMATLYRSFIGRTRLFGRIDNVIAGIQYKHYGGYYEPLPPQTKAKYERDSITITKALLVRLRRVYRGIPAVMVNCDGKAIGPNKQWESLARGAGFVPLSGPSDFLRSAKTGQRKIIFNSDGSHLSNDGNELYGAIAGDELASLGLVH